jgi:DegV family protein with EDD domain
MQIAYIDGPRLRYALLAGSQHIIRNAEGLNAINVFPVPDGDTGTNLANTMRSIAAALRQSLHRDAGSVLVQAARSAIEGARGNSGAIVAQFFQSLAHELGSEVRIGAKRLGHAAVIAAERTRSALSSPREGTMLTVLHDWAQGLHQASSHSDDILHVFHEGLKAARISLEKTRDILPEMRKAGVVDAGAKGFVHLLDGMAELLESGLPRRFRDMFPHAARSAAAGLPASAREEFTGNHGPLSHPALDVHGEADGPRYCTEALLSDSRIPLTAIRTALETLGDSIVVAGDESYSRIHVHSDRPHAVFDFLDQAGSVEQHKVDDMDLQRRLASRPGNRSFSIVVDTGCDLPSDFMFEHGIVKVPALITIDGKTRPDGPAIDISAILEKMKTDPDFSMSTSLPTETAFARAFTTALSGADEAIYLGLSSALSGTFQAGVRAAAAFGGKVHCIDSRSITAGEGLLVAKLAELREKGLRPAEAAAAIASARENALLYIAIKDLSSLIRTGRLHGLKSLVLRKFGLRPLLCLDKAGKLETAGIFAGETRGAKALYGKARKAIRQLRAGNANVKMRLQIVHVGAAEEAEALAARCASLAPEGTEVLVNEIGPLLASIGWLGALGVAILAD